MPKATADENSAALAADLRASALFDVRGKVVVVSGGGSGIGAMLAAGFVRNGASVYVFSRKDTAEYAVALTARGPGRCTAFRANLQQLETLQPLISEIEAREGRVDVLVNNAGTRQACNATEERLGRAGRVRPRRGMCTRAQVRFSSVRLARNLRINLSFECQGLLFCGPLVGGANFRPTLGYVWPSLGQTEVCPVR